MSGLQQVHVRVNDAATGKPTPCRVRFTDAEGKYYAPYGRLTEFATGPGVDVGGNLQPPTIADNGSITAQQFAYIDGTAEVGLPAELINVTITKGPEFRPLNQQITLASGKLALRFVLERWSNLRQQHWYPGDMRVHGMSPHAAWLDGAAEDLTVVNILARMTLVQDCDDWQETAKHSAACANILEFTGQQPAVERQDCMVVVNTHNTHPKLGSFGLLNCHRVVYPLSFGGPPFGEPYENWTLADWCDQCHRKNGLVVWTGTNMGLVGNRYGEPLADLIVGKVDAVEVQQFNWDAGPNPWTFDWYSILNCGLRLPLAGASGKDSNYLPLGCVRTYARLQAGQLLTYHNWIDAVRAGRTFATNGPLLVFSVNGQDPGATLDLRNDETIQICAEASSLIPFEHLEIVVNGCVVAKQAGTGNPATATVQKIVSIPDGGWVAARCWGTAWLPGFGIGQRVYAHTSPVYISVEDRPPPIDQAAVQRLLGHLSSMLSWVDNEGRFENDSQRARLRKVFEDATEVLQKRAQ